MIFSSLEATTAFLEIDELHVRVVHSQAVVANLAEIGVKGCPELLVLEKIYSNGVSSPKFERKFAQRLSNRVAHWRYAASGFAIPKMRRFLSQPEHPVAERCSAFLLPTMQAAYLSYPVPCAFRPPVRFLEPRQVRPLVVLP